MPNAQEIAEASIKEHEGLSLRPAVDTGGTLVIGYGHNIHTRPLTRVQAQLLLDEDMDDDLWAMRQNAQLRHLLDTLSPARQAVLREMAYQMGVPGLLLFKNTLRYMAQGLHDKAADGMLKSKWAREDTPARAKRLSDRYRRG